jgi:hypothetical protein
VLTLFISRPKDFDYQVHVDFSDASVSKPLSFNFQTGSGTELIGNGGFFLSGGAVGSVFRGFFFTHTGVVSIGDTCPPAGATILPFYPEFPFTLFALASQESDVVYACDGTVVGICEFEYNEDASSSPTVPPIVSTNPPSGVPSIPPSQAGSPVSATNPPTRVPTLPGQSSNSPSLSIAPSLSPSMSAAPTASPTFSLSAQNELVTCISVIDESDGQNFEARWAELRETYPDRPFCLLQPNLLGGPVKSRVHIPPAFSAYNTTNLYSAVVRDNGSLQPDDWFDICDMESQKKMGITRVGKYTKEDNLLSVFTKCHTLTLSPL